MNTRKREGRLAGLLYGATIVGQPHGKLASKLSGLEWSRECVEQAQTCTFNLRRQEMSACQQDSVYKCQENVWKMWGHVCSTWRVAWRQCSFISPHCFISLLCLSATAAPLAVSYASLGTLTWDRIHKSHLQSSAKMQFCWRLGGGDCEEHIELKASGGVELRQQLCTHTL